MARPPKRSSRATKPKPDTLALKPGAIRNAYAALTPLSASRLRISTSMHVLAINRALKPVIEDLLVVERKIYEDHGAKKAPSGSDFYFEVDDDDKVKFPNKTAKQKAADERDAFLETEHVVEAVPLKLSELMPSANGRKKVVEMEIEPAVLVSLAEAELLLDDTDG